MTTPSAERPQQLFRAHGIEEVFGGAVVTANHENVMRTSIRAASPDSSLGAADVLGYLETNEAQMDWIVRLTTMPFGKAVHAHFGVPVAYAPTALAASKIVQRDIEGKVYGGTIRVIGQRPRL